MGNAVENALNRASDEQRARALQVIEEARRNIKLVSVQQMDDISSSNADTIARQAQVIEEAKRTIPVETMQHVEEIGPPMNTPAPQGTYKSNVIDLHPQTQYTIESIEQGDGNNYQRENAVDRALARERQNSLQIEQEGRER